MTQIAIPSELPGILRSFTLSVLRTKPRDIIDHAVDYFSQLQRQQRQSVAGDEPGASVPLLPASSPMNISQQLQSRHEPADHNATPSGDASSTGAKPVASEHETAMASADNVDRTSPDFVDEEADHENPSSESTAEDEDDDDDEKNNTVDDLADEEAMRRQYVKKNENRRVSVAAERYNPEEDADSDHEQAGFYPKTPEQRQRLKDAVCHNLLFRTLESKQIDQVLDAMWEKPVTEGETIIQQGDGGDNFYVIDSGVYEIYVSKQEDFRDPVKVGEYNQTGSFGELALMYNQPRSATIVASTNGILWVMGRQMFRKLVLKHAFLKRQMYENFLRDLAILQSLTDYERSNVADALIPVEFAEKEIIIKQGDDGDRMFFIEDGECDIYMNDEFRKRLSTGDYFGELALLNHEPRSATVVAASPRVKLASLEVESFERLLGPCMDLIHRNTSKYQK